MFCIITLISQGGRKRKWNRKGCSAVTQAQKILDIYLIFLVANFHYAYFHYAQNWHLWFSALHLTFHIFHCALTFILFLFSNNFKIAQWTYLGYVFMYRAIMLMHGICIPVGQNKSDLGAVGLAQTILTAWDFFTHCIVGGMPNGKRCQMNTTREIWAAGILRYTTKTYYFDSNLQWAFQIRE